MTDNTLAFTVLSVTGHVVEDEHWAEIRSTRTPSAFFVTGRMEYNEGWCNVVAYIVM
jgi:hypothetical protein